MNLALQKELVCEVRAVLCIRSSVSQERAWFKVRFKEQSVW